MLLNNLPGLSFSFNTGAEVAAVPYGYIYLLYDLTILPALAVTARRLEDVGKSGWFFLIAFIRLSAQSGYWCCCVPIVLLAITSTVQILKGLAVWMSLMRLAIT